jgi:large subunit ribosomal protein L9
MSMMEVLLMKDVPKLGQKGSIIKVKLGYGRNYLLPYRFATLATKDNMRLLEVEKKHTLQVLEQQKEELKKVAQELEVTACTIEAKANEEGHLFGSVSYPMIQEAFRKLGFQLEPDSIQLEDASLYPIKQLGIFTITVRLHAEIVVKTKVWVVSQQQEASE